MRHFASYNKLLILIAGFITLSIFSFNMLVDPYRVWNLLSIKSFNEAKPRADIVDQLFKPLAVAHIKPDILFLGSSRVAYGMNPSHPLVRARGRPYNMALLGGDLYSIRRNLEHAFYINPNIKTVFMGLDFFAFSSKVDTPPTFSESRLMTNSINLTDVVKTTLTLDVTRDSILTVWSNLHDPALQRFSADGSLTAIPMSQNVKKYGMIERFERSLRIYLGESRLGNYERSDEAYADYQRIADIVRTNGAEFIVYINPVHALLLEAIHRTGNWEEYLSWRRHMANISPYWDFSGYNGITGEALEFDMNFFWDISHHRRHLGDRMIDIMIGSGANNKPGGGKFGVYVTHVTTENRAKEIDRQREEWLLNNAEAISWLLNQMLPKT